MLKRKMYMIVHRRLIDIMPRGCNTKGGLNGHFNHADP
jgi:hypothetical protein